MNADGINPLDGRESIVMQIRLSRVFIFRVWLGVRLLHIAMWVIGGRAEVIAPE